MEINVLNEAAAVSQEYPAVSYFFHSLLTRATFLDQLVSSIQ